MLHSSCSCPCPLSWLPSLYIDKFYSFWYFGSAWRCVHFDYSQQHEICPISCLHSCDWLPASYSGTEIESPPYIAWPSPVPPLMSACHSLSYMCVCACVSYVCVCGQVLISDAYSIAFDARIHMGGGKFHSKQPFRLPLSCVCVCVCEWGN